MNPWNNVTERDVRNVDRIMRARGHVGILDCVIRAILDGTYVRPADGLTFVHARRAVEFVENYRDSHWRASDDPTDNQPQSKGSSQ